MSCEIRSNCQWGGGEEKNTLILTIDPSLDSWQEKEDEEKKVQLETCFHRLRRVRFFSEMKTLSESTGNLSTVKI